jgi:16S rRNA (guanine527-N7)-methyltransferase
VTEWTPTPAVVPPAPLQGPEAARRVFHVKRLRLAEQYAGWLAGPGTVRGLIGPREVPRLWDRHILNCAVRADEIPEGATVGDVGSGAGLPGLVVAIARPDVRMTLIEPLLRRTTFLEEVVVALGLDNVEVVRGRADALHGERTFDVVTSRAVAGLDKLLDWSMPLVAPTGAVVAMKGSSAAEEVADARATLERWGCAEPVVTELGAGVVPETTMAVRVTWADPSRVSWRAPASTGSARRGSQKKRPRRQR